MYICYNKNMYMHSIQSFLGLNQHILYRHHLDNFIPLYQSALATIVMANPCKSPFIDPLPTKHGDFPIVLLVCQRVSKF